MLHLKTKRLTLVKSLLAAMLLGAPLAASAQDVEINEINFPDENFRNWLLEQDYGADGIITEEEMKGTTYINVFGKNISSLQGIEHFTALENLVCSFNALTTLDLSKNTALTSLNCYQNYQPATVNVSGCTALTTLDCRNSHITTLDASGCIALTELLCYGNQLTTLNVSGCVALPELYCEGNQLTALDVSGCVSLWQLDCHDNQLTALDVSGCIALNQLDCHNNLLTALDVSGCAVLLKLDCHDNLLTALDVSGSIALNYADCSRNKIEGTAMDALIVSLPICGGSMNVYDNATSDEGNVCTKTQIAAAYAKNWLLRWNNNGLWTAYDGYDEETSIAPPSTEAMEANVPVYTMSGQKMTGSLKGKKGIYIVGGKKVIVK